METMIFKKKNLNKNLNYSKFEIKDSFIVSIDFILYNIYIYIYIYTIKNKTESLVK
jgi:hypothetical protein